MKTTENCVEKSHSWKDTILNFIGIYIMQAVTYKSVLFSEMVTSIPGFLLFVSLRQNVTRYPNRAIILNNELTK